MAHSRSPVVAMALVSVNDASETSVILSKRELDSTRK